MNWHGKAISQLTDDEVKEACVTITGMVTNRSAAKDSPKAQKEKFPKNIDFDNSPNPIFNDLKTEINNEIQKRKIVVS